MGFNSAFKGLIMHYEVWYKHSGADDDRCLVWYDAL